MQTEGQHGTMRRAWKNRQNQRLIKSTSNTFNRRTPRQLSRISCFAPISRDSTSSLSQQVWEENHPSGEGRVYPFEQISIPKPRTSDTYELQLLRKIEAERGNDHLWDKYSIIPLSESNSLSDSSSSSELRIKDNPERKRFKSLRGLPRFSAYPLQLTTPDINSEYKEDFCSAKNSEVDNLSNVFLTLESLEELSLTEIKTHERVEYVSLVNTAPMGITKVVKLLYFTRSCYIFTRNNRSHLKSS